MAINEPSSDIAAILNARARAQSKPGKRADPHHLALVVECGGMRGAVAGGMMQVLQDAGMTTAFDSAHGSSAGACAAAYFLSGQSEAGRAIYHEDICNRAIVNPAGLLRYPSMVETDYIVDEIIAKKRFLNTDKIIASRTQFHVVTTSVSSGLPVVHAKFPDRQSILNALRASLRVPGLREPGVHMNGVLHIDGGISAPIPIFSATKSGATHILVIRTKKAGEVGSLGWASRLEFAMLKFKYGAHVAESYLRAADDRIIESNKSDGTHRVAIRILQRAATSAYCGWHTIDKATLRSVEHDAMDAARALLGDQ